MSASTLSLNGGVAFAVTSRVHQAPVVWRLRNALAWTFLWGLLTTWVAKAFTRLTSIPTMTSELRLVLRRVDGRMVDFGVVSRRVVTDAGVAAIVDAFQNTVELENFKYHGFGTGTTAEAASDAALVTELTTQYAADNTRPTGSTEEGATANIYKTIATLSPDSGGTLAITEHGVFSATSAGTLLDRSKFNAVNVVAGSDSLQATYQLTLNSGG